VTTITYASFWIEWAFVSVPGVLTLTLAVLAAVVIRRRRGALLATLLAIGNFVCQFWVLWFLISPVMVGPKTCGSAMSCARLRPAPGEEFTAYDTACHSQGVQTVTILLLLSLAAAVICGWPLVGRLRGWRGAASAGGVEALEAEGVG
jgi:hypothetical protein